MTEPHSAEFRAQDLPDTERDALHVDKIEFWKALRPDSVDRQALDRYASLITGKDQVEDYDAFSVLLITPKIVYEDAKRKGFADEGIETFMHDYTAIWGPELALVFAVQRSLKGIVGDRFTADSFADDMMRKLRPN